TASLDCSVSAVFCTDTQITNAVPARFDPAVIGATIIGICITIITVFIRELDAVSADRTTGTRRSSRTRPTGLNRTRTRTTITSHSIGIIASLWNDVDP